MRRGQLMEVTGPEECQPNLTSRLVVQEAHCGWITCASGWEKDWTRGRLDIFGGYCSKARNCEALKQSSDTGENEGADAKDVKDGELTGCQR